MNTTHIRKKLTASTLCGAFVAAAAAVILAAPANADTGGFEPPDPCLIATSCENVHPRVALNPMIDDTKNAVITKMFPGLNPQQLNPQPLPPG